MSINVWNDFEDLESSKISENIWETSEQYQEKARKTQSQLKKIQKDEQFAKEDNQKLFLILSRFIQDLYYQSLIWDISRLLQISVSSRWILAFISLFYPDATYFVSDTLQKKEKLNLLLKLPKYSELQNFDEKTISPQITSWITEWIRLMEEFLVHDSGSILMIKKMHQDISWQHSFVIVESISHFLIFFFATRNITISEEKSMEFARFIQKNLSELLWKYLQAQEANLQTLLQDVTLTSDDLFR